MPSEFERLATLETGLSTVKEDISRMRQHIADLLTFKANLEGGMGLIKWVSGLGLLGNLAILLKLFIG